jgi:hypothetical protein
MNSLCFPVVSAGGFLVVLFLCPGLSYAQSDTALHEKHYIPRVLKPAVKSGEKEMETDRPDVTESAYTVDAGHFQVESDLYRCVRNSNNGVVTTSHNFNLGNYKFGLSAKADIQFVIPTYVINSVREKSTNKILSRRGGFDDISIRLKYNVWGNYGGKTALAILPFISLPASSFSDNGVTGGIVIPFALKINEETDLGSQVETALFKEDDGKYHPEYLYSLTLGKTISPKLNSFMEGVITYSPYLNCANFFANGGIIYSISWNFKLDAGVNYGINKGAEKILFTGFSARL